MEQDDCLWTATAAPAPFCPPLAGAVEAGVVVVGAGYAGLSAALALTEAGERVVVLEAGQPGSGASGRNGGQVIAGLRHHEADLVARLGAGAGAAHRFGGGDAAAVFALVARLGIDCDAIQGGWLQVADTAAGLAEGARRARAWERLGVLVQVLGPDEVAALAGTRAYGGGWLDPRGGTVQPLSYARGLARAAMAAGAAVHGGSAAVSVRRVGAAWLVQTAGGSVTAPKLLLATNALTDGLWPGLRRMVLPVWSFQVATEPGVAPLADGLAVSDTRRVLRYFRADRAGRVVVGGKGTGSAPLGARAFRLQERTLGRLYPALRNAPIQFRWGGQVGIIPDRFPRVVRLGPGALATFGCNGKGIAWNTALGPLLAEALATGRDGALPIPVTGMEPVPFHALRRVYVGVAAAWLRARDAMGGAARVQ